MINPDPMQLQHRLSVNVTDHYEWTTNANNFYPGYSMNTTNSSNVDTTSLNGSLSSGTSANESSPYPLLNPMGSAYFNPCLSSVPMSNETPIHPTPYLAPPVYLSAPVSPRIMSESTRAINDKLILTLSSSLHRNN
jgi:hypothetical protein